VLGAAVGDLRLGREVLAKGEGGTAGIEVVATGEVDGEAKLEGADVSRVTDGAPVAVTGTLVGDKVVERREGGFEGGEDGGVVNADGAVVLLVGAEVATTGTGLGAVGLIKGESQTSASYTRNKWAILNVPFVATATGAEVGTVTGAEVGAATGAEVGAVTGAEVGAATGVEVGAATGVEVEGAMVAAIGNELGELVVVGVVGAFAGKTKEIIGEENCEKIYHRNRFNRQCAWHLPFVGKSPSSCNSG
jgi:hypothetical protein